jgi:hypothetical protein
MVRYTFVIAVVLLTHVSTLAQKKASLPGDLNEKSSVREIITWLDQTTFRDARIVLKDSYDASYRQPWDDNEPAKNTFNFIKGFRVTNIDGCNLMLRNDDARMVDKSKLVQTTQPIIADVWVQLDRMSHDRGKHTHRYTKDPEKARLLGAWRTEFKYSGWFGRTIVGLHLYSAAWKEPQRWQGYSIAFTFETKEMGEKFDAAFRQAIRLCRSK